MRIAILISLIFHGLLVAVVYFGLPYFERPLPKQRQAIPITMVTIADKTVVKPRAQKVDTVKKPKKKDLKKPKSRPKESKPEEVKKKKTTKVKKQPVPKDAVPKITKKKKKPVEKKTVKVTPSKPKKKKVDFSALLDKRKPKKTFGDRLNDRGVKEKPESLNFDEKKELADISAAMKIFVDENRCWSVPSGAKAATKDYVKVRFQMRPNGQLLGIPKVIDPIGGRFRVVEESAVRAVRLCAPFEFLPKDKYDLWKDFILNFDLKEALER